jgi:AraC-like DNA-binding protein
VIRIEYNLTSYEDFFRHIAKCLKLKIADNTLSFTPDKGTGYIKFVNLMNGLQLLIYDYIPTQEILYHRKKSDRDFYVLRLDEFSGNDSADKASIFFGNTSQEWFYMASANTQLRQVNIIFNKKWLDEYFADEETGEKISSYLALKNFVVFKLMDAELRRLMLEVFNLPAEKHFEQMIIQNRTALILERFFSRVYKDISSENIPVKISAKEWESIKKVESELLKDFSQQPPAIAQLSRIAAMSPSKLKILFKEVYGSPINQYYQRHRMNKAKAMLLSKRYSVKEAAGELGFASVSSFNKAFYKAFEELPAEIAVPE